MKISPSLACIVLCLLQYTSTEAQTNKSNSADDLAPKQQNDNRTPKSNETKKLTPKSNGRKNRKSNSNDESNPNSNYYLQPRSENVFSSSPPKSKVKRCLSGYMTDLQSWIDEFGKLSETIERSTAIDLSEAVNVEPKLRQRLQTRNVAFNETFRFISMARCKLNRVPKVFTMSDKLYRRLYETVEYLSFYGNEFSSYEELVENYDVSLNVSQAMEAEIPEFLMSNNNIKDPLLWTVGFHDITFTSLRQLDLRKCNITTLNKNSFSGMPNLEALFLGENKIKFVDSFSFYGLFRLQHLDISNNCEDDDSCHLTFESDNIFKRLELLKSADFSYTKMAQRNDAAFKGFGENFEQLSICHAGLINLDDYTFNNTNLKYLDVSGNSGILNGNNALGGIEDTLQILYAEKIQLRTLEILFRFQALEILKLTDNEVALITSKTARTLKELKVLDLDKNRMPSWFIETFSYMPKLFYLSLKDNNINLISEDMISDIKNISYISLSGNFIVCNCHTRELFELALRNELVRETGVPYAEIVFTNYEYHIAYEEINSIIMNRKNLSRVCYQNDLCDDETINLESEGNFLFADYDSGVYHCLLVEEGKSVPFSSVNTCQQTKRDTDFIEVIEEGWSKIMIMITVPTVIFPILLVGFLFRRRVKYFYITMRNSAMLSLINKDEMIDSEGTIFNYDVFVSYCNEDRNWVLDYLLPHVEKDCNVSVCLHERDFQVGLSILENIVSCMDRSRSIMLIISKKFLLSQWCQFEMHLAQHRLLETRREDLILVLLEEIPRRLRPTTLQYLMLTKTYIIWSQEEKEQAIFWKRLKKSIIMYRLKQPENTSIA